MKIIIGSIIILLLYGCQYSIKYYPPDGIHEQAERVQELKYGSPDWSNGQGKVLDIKAVEVNGLSADIPGASTLIEKVKDKF